MRACAARSSNRRHALGIAANSHSEGRFRLRLISSSNASLDESVMFVTQADSIRSISTGEKSGSTRGRRRRDSEAGAAGNVVR